MTPVSKTTGPTYQTVARNKTGSMDVSTWPDGAVWIVLKDKTSICSIGLTADEWRAARSAIDGIADPVPVAILPQFAGG